MVEHQRVEYRVAAGRRYTPCNGVQYEKGKYCYGTNVRVKIVEPGVQGRVCSRCLRSYWFILEVSAVPGESEVLKLRWIDADTAHAVIAAAQIDGPDLADLV